jgi:NAD(P)-dependent dehydrogenase (short-subunit alcohol dehydrogenase family)
MVRTDFNAAALVTGGSRGIGRGIVRKLAESGVKRIAINYFDNDKAAGETARCVKDLGAEPLLLKGDVTKPESMRHLFGEVKARWGELGIYVHCARPNPGTGSWLAPPAQITPEGWQQAFSSQAVAFTIGCQEAEKLMPGGGRIIGLTYGTGSRTGSWQAWIAMGGAKAALESTCRYFAVAYARRGITVNCLSPNFVWDSVVNALPPNVQTGIKGWQEMAWTPMGRMGAPADTGNAVALLCTNEAAFITGQTIYVDGGASVMMPELPLDIQGVT